MSEYKSAAAGTDEMVGILQIHKYLEVARRRKWWILLTTTAVFLSTVIVAVRLPDVYRSETVILVDPQKVPDTYVASTVSSSIADRLSTIRQQVMSPTRLKRIIDTLGLYPELRGRLNEQQIISNMQKSTVIELLPESSLTPRERRLSAFRIAFVGKNPVEVAQVANQLAAMFIEENLKVREQQFYGTAEFLENELREIKRQLEQKEEQIRSIKTRYVMDLPESQRYHFEALSSLRTQLQASLDRVARAQQQRVFLKSTLASTAPTLDMDAGSGGAMVSPVQTQVQKLESYLSDLQGRYGSNHPDVRKVQSQLDELRAKAAAEEESSAVSKEPAEPIRRVVRNPVVEAELQKLDQEVEEQTKLQPKLQEQINFHVGKLERIPIFEQQTTGLMRDYDTLRTHYRTLLDKKLSAEMASALETRQKGERFVILDPAPVPERPYGPNRPMISLAGLLGGLMGGVGLAIMVEMTDESVRNEREAAKIVGKSVLAAIPRIFTRQQQRQKRVRAVTAVVGTVACSVLLAVLFLYLGGRLF